MTKDHDEIPREQSRSFDRLVNFTDAVVAIAITLQLLLLVDVEAPVSGQTVWQVIAENFSHISAFIISFAVVMVLWFKHNRVFNVMRTYDGMILWLNSAWLLCIVFLPWPTAMYGMANDAGLLGNTGFGLLYWWNMAAISGLGLLIARHAWRTPHLLEPGVNNRNPKHYSFTRVRGISIFLYLIVIGLVSEYLPAISNYLAVGLILISIVLRTPKAAQSGLLP